MFKAIEEIDEKIKQLEALRDVALTIICKESHPLKLGDVVVVNDHWSRDGKTMVVDRLSVSKDSIRGYGFTAEGYVNKKNGEAGVYRGKWRNEKQGEL